MPGGRRSSTGGSVMFFAANRSKRSLALDFKDEQGHEALLRLVDGADVFVQSLRSGTAERLGLGSDALRARNERLVYCSVRAFGRSGPLADEPGYDPLMQAFAGLISITGEPDRPGVRVGASVIDLGTGVWAALGVLAALLERASTGRGRDVSVALYDTALSLVGVSAGRRPAQRRRAGAPRDRVPVDRPVRGLPDLRRRADDRGGERRSLPAALRAHRPRGARRRSSVPDEPRPRREPRAAAAADP